MPKSKSKYTQADVERAIRAAKKNNASAVEIIFNNGVAKIRIELANNKDEADADTLELEKMIEAAENKIRQ